MYTSADSIPKEVTRLMAQLFHRNMPAWWRKCCFLFLAFCWIAGLLSGASACLAAGDSLNSLMRRAAARPVSIVSQGMTASVGRWSYKNPLISK